MPRTRNAAETAAENIVPLPTTVDETAPVDDQVADALPPELAEPPAEAAVDAEEPPAPAPQSRYGGPSLNRVELVGRFARDPELRYTQGGMEVVSFRIATNGAGAGGAEFHQCTAFGSTARFVAEYLRKGRLVLVEGRLQTREYTKDGIRRWITSVPVHRLQVLDQLRPTEQ